MLQQENLEYGNDTYQLTPHTGFQALDLARRAGAFMSRLTAKGLIGETTILLDLKFFEGFSEELGRIDSEEYRWLLETTFSKLVVTTPGKKMVKLDTSEKIAEHFAGKIIPMHTVMIMVWVKEKIPPFVGASEDPGETGA